MAENPINVLSLCSGVGMLDLGFHLAFDARTVCYIEREAFAVSQLVALMEAGALDAAPVYADLATFDGRPWRGVVDSIIAGLPCQPYSVAGKRVGNDDKRSWGEGDGPIPQAIRIIGEVQPALVWFENVPAWVTGGFFQPVAEALSAMGYRVERPLFLAAGDVGASHKRERVFILAVREGRGFGKLRESSGGDGSAELANASIDDAQQTPTSGPNNARGIAAAGTSGAVAHPSSPRPQGSELGRTRNSDWGGAQTHGPTEQFRGLFAPGPSDPRWPAILARWPHVAPALEPGVRVLVDGAAINLDESRRHQLRAIGNGAVPICFSLAVTVLAREAGIA